MSLLFLLPTLAAVWLRSLQGRRIRMPSGRIPLVKGALADAVVAAKLRDLGTRFVLFEDADNLLLAESTVSHLLSPCHYFSRRILRKNQMVYWMQAKVCLQPHGSRFSCWDVCVIRFHC